MNLSCPKATQWLIIISLLLLLFVDTDVVRAEDDVGCGHGCQTYKPDVSQMSRCVRYACRQAFRTGWVIRMGKRVGKGAIQKRKQVGRLQNRLKTFNNQPSGQWLELPADSATQPRLLSVLQLPQQQLQQNLQLSLQQQQNQEQHQRQQLQQRQPQQSVYQSQRPKRQSWMSHYEKFQRLWEQIQAQRRHRKIMNTLPRFG